MPQKNQIEPATQFGRSIAEPGHRHRSLLQQRLTAFDAAERVKVTWQDRLKATTYIALFVFVGMPLGFVVIAFPCLYPRDFEGLGILLGVSVDLAVFFTAAYFVGEWVEARIEQYWFWRASGVLLFLSIAGSMLYAMAFTADYWLPHFR